MGMKMETDNNTITAEDFSIPLSSMGRSPRQKINKETVALQDRLEQRDLIAICRTFHPKLERKISFLIAHGTFSRTYNMWGHKTSFDKFKIKIASSILSDDKVMVEISEIETKKSMKRSRTQKAGSSKRSTNLINLWSVSWRWTKRGA